MNGHLVIRPQRYPTVNGETPLSYGIFLETNDVIEGLSHWQDCDEVFVAYSWTRHGAERAISELERLL